MSQKVFVLGLDCAAPELVFDLWADRLPNLTRLRGMGVWGPLESTIPPITVPAWMCMMTGKDPGTLGIYGFRNRRDHSYDGLQFANSHLVREPTVWDVLAEHNRRTIALGVPLTYPPRPIHGLLITDFLAPDTRSEYTYPPELKAEIRDVVGEYLFDARQFRTEEKAQLLADIHAMTAQRFALARHLATTKPWDFFIMVDMGPDRMHHGFWKYFDPMHLKYVPGNPFESAMRDYYIALDAHIGALIQVLEPGTRLLVVSDHGAKRMDGGLCFNEWLMQEGYLVLKQTLPGVTKFTPDLVDWERTRAWGDGGYYGRLFLNMRGREPQGVVPPEQAENLKAELTSKLEALPDHKGRPLGNRVYRPEVVYSDCRNVAPDLIVYFGDLHWRSVGSVGHGTLWVQDNDSGPDDANHAQQGLFIMAEIGPPATPQGRRQDGISLYDVAPTILEIFGIAPPPGMGRNIVGVSTPPAPDSVYTPEEEAELARRLEDLGYL